MSPPTLAFVSRLTRHPVNQWLAAMTELAPPSDEKLIDALAEIVFEAMAYSARKAADAHDNDNTAIKAIDAADLIATSQAVIEERAWVDNPVRRSLKSGAHEIGAILHKRVGHDGLLAVVEEVAGRDQTDYHRRMSFIDSAFNGIGSWYS